MCRKGELEPCGDPSHHPEGLTLDGPRTYGARSRRAGTRSAAASLPPRAYPDAGPRTRRPRRRTMLVGLVGAAAAACGPGAGAAALPVALKQQEEPEPPTQVPEPT